MPSNFTGLTVTWADESDNYVTTADITNDIKGIPLFTRTGTGEINEAILTIRARDGRYITSTTPKQIDQFDRIRIECTDSGGNTYDRWFEVDEIIPTQTKKEGTILTVECLGTEYHTQRVHFSRPFWFTDGKTVIQNMGDSHKENTSDLAGNRQPLLTKHLTSDAYSTSTLVGSDIPAFTLNHYEYGLHEDNFYNRLLDMSEGFGSPVASGGILEFFDFTFETDAVNSIQLAMCVSGERRRSLTDFGNMVTLENTTAINVGDQEGGIANEAGTLINSWGANTMGSLPVERSKYKSQIWQFLFRPYWVSGIAYKSGSKVTLKESDASTFGGSHWKANVDTTAGDKPSVSGKWDRIFMGGEFGNSLEYSLWTTEKASLWIQPGSNPTVVTQGTAAVGTAVLTAGAVSSVTINTAGTGYFGTVEVLFTGGTPERPAYGKVTTDSAGTVTGVTITEGGTGYDIVPTVVFSGGGADGWTNSGSGTEAGFYDSNLTISHEDFRRIFVTERMEGTGGVDSHPLDARFLMADAVSWPRGHRVLSIGTNSLANPAVKDRNGILFEDSVIERQTVRDGAVGFEWVVIHKLDDNNDEFQIVVKDEGIIYRWDADTKTFSTIETQDLGNDCHHVFKSITNVFGFDRKTRYVDNVKFPETAENNASFTKNVKSAIEVVYEAPNIVATALNAEAYYKKGAWLNFEFPYPVRDAISPFTYTEGVGDLYGGGTRSVATSINEPATLDISNMGYTHDGFLGFNHGDSSADLGPISSIAFAIRLKILDAADNVLNGTGTIRVTGYDTKDHVVTQDFEVRFTDGTWQPANLPISGFSLYKANKPRWIDENSISLAGFINLINPSEQELVEIFEWRNVRFWTIQIQNFYDDDGRYAPEGNVEDMDNIGINTVAGGKIIMAIDDFHFKKPLLVNTGQQLVRNLETTFLQRPDIMIYDQLLNDAKAQLEIEKFRTKEFKIESSGQNIFDIEYSEAFILKNDKVVSDSDNGTGTIVLVPKRIEYSITKPVGGAGGLRRTVLGRKRFT